MKITHALVVKLVDTKDLKSLPLAECQFESGRGHHYMKNIQIISDKNKKSLKIKSILQKQINSKNIKKSNVVIVIGGDGFMLQTLKKNKNLNKFFYGVNSGNYGFLMNKFSSKNIIKNLLKAKMITISPLEMTVRNNKNQIKKNLAINEVSILRQSRQAASLSITYGSKNLIKTISF